MSSLATLLHAWRLRRIRWAMRTLNRRLAAYEAAYGQCPVDPPRADTMSLSRNSPLRP